MNKCKVISIANQKGSVGKTTTTFNLGVGLVRVGKKVILVDYDPQGSGSPVATAEFRRYQQHRPSRQARHLTICCGYPDNDEIDVTIASIMQKVVGDESFNFDEGIIHQAEGVDLLHANIEHRNFVIFLRLTAVREFYGTLKILSNICVLQLTF